MSSKLKFNPHLFLQPRFLGEDGERVMFQIQLTEPFVARDVRAFSVYPSENEVILPPNVSFEVVSVVNLGHGLHIVQYKQTESLDVILDLTYVDPAAPAPLAPGKKVRIDQAALMAQHDDRIKRWLRGVEEAEVVRQLSDGRWAIQVADGRERETWVPEGILRVQHPPHLIAKLATAGRALLAGALR